LPQQALAALSGPNAHATKVVLPRIHCIRPPPGRGTVQREVEHFGHDFRRSLLRLLAQRHLAARLHRPTLHRWLADAPAS